MQETAVCFTGHRVIPEAHRAPLKAALEQCLRAHIAQGDDTFLAGGAQGFDRMAAEAVLRLKAEFPQVRLILLLPYAGREESPALRALVAQADAVEVVSPFYHGGCMHQRDRKLVDRSHACIAYCTQTTGGTVYTVNYALDAGIPVTNLAIGLK